MSMVFEWCLIAIGAVVVGVVLGAMLVLGVVIAKINLEDDVHDDSVATAREDRLRGVRRSGADREGVYYREG